MDKKTKPTMSNAQLAYARKVHALLEVQRAEVGLRAAIMLPTIPGQHGAAQAEENFAHDALDAAREYLQGVKDGELLAMASTEYSIAK